MAHPIEINHLARQQARAIVEVRGGLFLRTGRTPLRCLLTESSPRELSRRLTWGVIIERYEEDEEGFAAEDVELFFVMTFMITLEGEALDLE